MDDDDEGMVEFDAGRGDIGFIDKRASGVAGVEEIGNEGGFAGRS